MRVLFPNLRSLHNLAANLLLYGSISAVLYSFSTISTSIIQGCNYFKVPVINSGISLGVHIVLVVFMIKYTDLRAYGLLIGDIIFPLLILILNAVFIKKKYHTNPLEKYSFKAFGRNFHNGNGYYNI